MESISRDMLMLTVFFLVLVIFFPAGMASAASSFNPVGTWIGSVQLPGTSLPIEVTFSLDENEQLAGSLDISAQGVSGIPLSEIEPTTEGISFNAALPGGAAFTGTFTDEENITGSFTQAGMSFPFSLQLVPAEAPVIDTGDECLQGLDEFVSQLMTDWHVPGTAVAVVKNGEVAFAKGFGLRDLDGQLLVTSQTQFGIGSSTKAFTTTLIGMLVDSGKLDWDTPVKEYIPGFELSDPWLTTHVTLRDFAAHRSGLPRHDAALMFNPELSRQEVIENLAAFEPSADFRTTWQYNNYGYITAAYAMEQVTGKTWEQLVQEYILQPLAMQRSNVTIDAMASSPDYALPYLREQSGPAQPDYWRLGAAAPAGSINSSVLDMAEWVKFQLSGKAGAEQLLSAKQLAMIQSPQISANPAINQPAIRFSSYGLGWMVESYRGQYVVQHGGNTVGYSAMVSLLPDYNSGVVVLTNLHGTPLPHILAYNVIDRLLGEEPIDLNGSMLQALQAAIGQATQQPKAQPVAPQIVPNQKELEEYAGTYRHPLYGSLRIEVVDGKLHGSYYLAEIQMSHSNHDTFSGIIKLMPTQIPFQFMRSLRGDVDRVMVGFEPSAESIEFTRVTGLDAAALQKLTGIYHVLGMQFTVKVLGQELLLTAPGQPDSVLVPATDKLFNVKGLQGFSVEFVFAPTGEVTGMILHQPGGSYTGERIIRTAE